MEPRVKSPAPLRNFLFNQGLNTDQYGLRLSVSEAKENRRDQVSSSTSLQGKTLLQHMMPILQVLRLWGALPLHFHSSGRTARFRLVSRAMLYSLCVYSLVLVALRITFFSWFDDGMKGSSSFSKTIYSILGLILASQMVLIPTTYWFEARNMATLLSDWSNFQEMYTRGTGKCVEFNLPRNRLIAGLLTISVITFTLLTLYELLYYDYQLQLWNFRDISIYFIMDTLRNSTAMLWFTLCRSTKMAARSMLQHFKQDMETSTRPADTISKYMELWLELSRLVAYIGTAFCNVYGHLVVYLVAILTIYIYYLLFMMIEGASGNLVWLICESAISILLLYVICDGATGVYQQVGICFRDYLLSLRLNPRYWCAHKEVDTFVRMLDVEPPVISLNGYVTINRGLLTSIGSTLVTYLVVLVQFRLSSR